MNTISFTMCPSEAQSSVRRADRSRAFTMIELLVVLAVLAVIIALLLPAVQQAREAARRLTCRNNLKQIGLALHNYHNVHACLPTGVLTTSSMDAYCWMVFLLPHLDQSPLYSRISPNGREHVMEDYFSSHRAIIPGGDTVLSVFRCPSSGQPSHTIQMGPGNLPAFAHGYAISDYKGCRGANTRPNGLFHFQNISNKPPNIVRWTDVTDGLTNTIAVGESAYPGTDGVRWPAWVGSPMHFSGVLFDTSTWDRMNCVPSFAGRYWVNASSDACALSFHSQIVQFAMADGSVRTLSQNLDRDTYKWLGSRNDGHPVSLDE